MFQADSDDDSDGEADEAEPSAAPKTPVVIGLLPKSSDVTAPGTSRRRKHSESSVVPVKKKRSRKSKFQRLYTVSRDIQMKDDCQNMFVLDLIMTLM